jgi:hypothetical protein
LGRRLNHLLHHHIRPEWQPSPTPRAREYPISSSRVFAAFLPNPEIRSDALVDRNGLPGSFRFAITDDAREDRPLYVDAQVGEIYVAPLESKQLAAS